MRRDIKLRAGSRAAMNRPLPMRIEDGFAAPGMAAGLSPFQPLGIALARRCRDFAAGPEPGMIFRLSSKIGNGGDSIPANSTNKVDIKRNDACPLLALPADDVKNQVFSKGKAKICRAGNWWDS